MRTFYVYILSNTAMVLYVGVTSISKALWEHTEKRSSGSSKFCLRYHLHKLVYTRIIQPPVTPLREKSS
jgi:predicted GIY-YIG superfamily endonuclease